MIPKRRKGARFPGLELKASDRRSLAGKKKRGEHVPARLWKRIRILELLHEREPPRAMSFDEAMAAVDAGAVLIDGRDPEEFARGHLRGSINVGLAGRYAEFAGSVVKADVDIVLLVDDGAELEAKNRLARIGFDRVIGHVVDPLRVMLDQPEHVQIASRLTAVEFENRRAALDHLQLVDVRNPGEVALGAIPGSVDIPIRQLPSRLDELEKQFGAAGLLLTAQIDEVRAAVAIAADDPRARDAHLRRAQGLYMQVGAAGHAARLGRELDGS